MRGPAGIARKAYCAPACGEALSSPLHYATSGVAEQRQLPGPSCTRSQAHRSTRHKTDSLRVTFMPSAIDRTGERLKGCLTYMRHALPTALL